MLRTLTIKNYQGHKELTVDLGQVTSLTGPTDAGKSSVLRALWWALANQGPTAPGYHGTNDTAVSVTLDNGTAITRRRSTRGNGYTISPPGGPESAYNAIRFDVPVAVQALLAVHPNAYQRQHDGAFWLSANASEVGRALNAVVDLDVIDTGLSFVKKLEATATATLGSVQTSIATADQTIAKLVWVEEAQRDWDVFRELRRQYLAVNERRGEVHGKLTHATTCVENARELAHRHAQARGVVSLQELLDETQQRRATIASHLAQSINKLEGLPIDADFVILRRNAITEIRNKRWDLCNALERAVNASAKATTLATAYTVAEAAATKCPTCGKPL